MISSHLGHLGFYAKEYHYHHHHHYHTLHPTLCTKSSKTEWLGRRFTVLAVSLELILLETAAPHPAQLAYCYMYLTPALFNAITKHLGLRQPNGKDELSEVIAINSLHDSRRNEKHREPAIWLTSDGVPPHQTGVAIGCCQGVSTKSGNGSGRGTLHILLYDPVLRSTPHSLLLTNYSLLAGLPAYLSRSIPEQIARLPWGDSGKEKKERKVTQCP